MSVVYHSDALSWFRANETLLFLFNAACLHWRSLHVCLYAWTSTSILVKPENTRTHTDRRERQRSLHLIDSSDLSLPIQFNGEICRWKTRWNMSEVKPSTLCETLVLTNIELYPFIATILLTLLTMTASTETGERSFCEMNRI